MDWTAILRQANVPESPGRQAAARAALEHAAWVKQQAQLKVASNGGRGR